MNKSSTIIVILITILSTGLLVGNNLNFKWAGGTGFEKHEPAKIYSENSAYFDDLLRGETFSSTDKNTYSININNTTLFLDNNTEIKLLDSRQDKEKISVIQGRVVIQGKITITTREIQTEINDKASFVHYSWLDDIEIAPINGNVKILIDEKEQIFESAVKIHTLSPYETQLIEFNPQSSSAKEFYEKVL